MSFSEYEKLSYMECMKMMAKDMSNFLVELDERIGIENYNRFTKPSLERMEDILNKEKKYV